MGFFCNRINEKHFFTLPVVNDNQIVRSTSDGVEGKLGLVRFEAVGGAVFRNLWLPLTMGRTKMAFSPCARDRKVV